MFALLFVLITIVVILEALSLKRDPGKVGLDYVVSTFCVEPGATFEVQAVVTNRSRLPVGYLELKEVYPSDAKLPESLVRSQRYDGTYLSKKCRVRGRRRKKLTLETSIEKRGVHVFRSEAIVFGDFLGFREISKNVSLRREIVVYPERLKTGSLTDAVSGFYGDMVSKRFLIRDPILTSGFREYTGREPMKDIHWLQSAHRGQLMVREYDYNRQLSACIILSTDSISYGDDDVLDRCCSTVRTVCELMIEQGASVSFFTNARLKRVAGKPVWSCNAGAGNMGGLLEGLGRITYYAVAPVDKLLEYALRESDYDSAFILILPAGDRRGEEAADRLTKQTGRELAIYYASPVVSEPIPENGKADID